MARDVLDERVAVGFARVLRGLGVAVPVGSTLTFARAVAEVGVDDEAAVYWAGRATLLTNPEDAPLYDRAFAGWWRRQQGDRWMVAGAAG